MAVTVISRPLGHKLKQTQVSGTALDDGSGKVFIYNSVPHGLTTGDSIYVESNIDAYNGFKEVFVYDANSIFPRNNGENISFKQSTELIYYNSELNHGWQCVHLPIVYELESNLYPVNSVDPQVSTAAYGFINGYFALIHGALSGPNALLPLDYVVLTDGVGGSKLLQVIEVVSTTITVFNWDGTGSGIDKIQRVRNNYHIDVRVFAGLPVGHRWESEKPYELAATLKFVPDSDNKIKFSISEILKGYITTRNNLTLDTLPNNIDFFTSFYIEYAEGYDTSNGTDITAFLDTFTDDSEEFEGQAVNAMLPFKNLYSGFMSEYIDSETILARWLTTMDVPIIFVGLYFDLSFINRHEGDIKINKNGTLYLTIPNPGIGILRVPIEAQPSDTDICIQAWTGSGETVYNIDVFSGGEDWSIGGGASVTLNGFQSSSELTQTVFKNAGTYTISWNVSSSESDGIIGIRYKKSGITVSNVVFENIPIGSNSGSQSITLTDDADELVVQVTNASSSEGTYLLTGLSVSGEQYITESICLKVVTDCNTFIADDLRLIETGPFRQLE